ncbi:MAG: C10 family peptidase [Dehalococcoidales bacterium]|nr:C10 family peptidase [Dehalococcoidales bacterium]
MKVKCFLLLCAFLSLSVLFVQSPVFSADNEKLGVSEKEAREVALFYVRGYASTITEWKGAVIGSGSEYYTDEKVSAYEFSVFTGNRGVGYIVISARTDWMPVLEFGTGSPPSHSLEKAKKVAQENAFIEQNDNSKPKYYYDGATFYLAEIGDKMKRENKAVNLTDLKIVEKPRKIDLKMNKKLASETWNRLFKNFLAGSSPTQLIANDDMESGNPPTNWTLEGSGASYSQSSEQHTNGLYSLALTRNGNDCSVFQTIDNYSDYHDQQLTLFAYVWANQADSVTISIYDGVTTQSSAYQSDNSSWQLLYATITVAHSPTTLTVKLNIANNNTTAYFDDVTLPASSWGGNFPTLSPTDVCSGQIEVPAYYQDSDNSGYGDDSGGSGDFPSYVGSAADPWYAWDGCTPISGAMILGHWRNRGYSGIPSDNSSDSIDALIDVNHHFMSTLEAGWTWPEYIPLVAPGIDNGLHDSAEYYSYDFYTDGHWIGPDDWDSMIKSEIDANRPFILTVSEVLDPWYGHSVAAKGYAVDQDQQYIHANNTWDTDNDYYIQFGTWAFGHQTVAIPAPIVTTDASTNIGPFTAILNGSLSNLGGNISANVSFEWGLTTSYGNTTTIQGLSAIGSYSANITGLSANTTYHFRAKAEGTGTTTYGSDQQFGTDLVRHVIIGGGAYSPLNTTADRYCVLQGAEYWDNTEFREGQIVSINGTLKNFRVDLTSAPGVGKSYTLRLKINGSNSAIVVTISDNATTGLDDTHEVSINPGDRVYLSCTPSGTPASAYARWSIDFESETAGASLVMGSSLSGTGLYDTNYNPLMTGWSNNDSTESNKREVIPTNGTLKNLYVRTANQIRAGQTLQYVVRVNGTDTDLECTLDPPVHEYYNTGYNGVLYTSSSTRFITQTFTPSDNHTITRIRVMCYRSGSPGTITIEIQGTNGSGLPDNSAIASGSLAGNSITTSVAGEWYEVTLGNGAILSAGTKYAIVFKALNPSGSFYTRVDGSSPTYTGGNTAYSNNSGASWTAVGQDMMFEEFDGFDGIDTANNTSDEVNVAVGDVVTLKLVGTPSGSGRPSVYPMYGCTFIADVDGESIVMNCPNGDMNATATRYTKACGGQQTPWGGTESTYYQLANPFTAKKFYVQLTGVAGSSGGYAFTIRKNGNDTDLQISISGDSVYTGSDNTHSSEFSAGDYITVEATPIGGPTVRGAFFGFVVDTGG